MLLQVIEGTGHEVFDAYLLADHQPQVLKAELLERNAAEAVDVRDEAAAVLGRTPLDALELVQRLVGDGASILRHNGPGFSNMLIHAAREISINELAEGLRVAEVTSAPERLPEVA